MKQELESKMPNSVVSIENYHSSSWNRNTAGGQVDVYAKETLPDYQRIGITEHDYKVISIEITHKCAESFVILC